MTLTLETGHHPGNTVTRVGLSGVTEALADVT
jgi:hypothetical protein